MINFDIVDLTTGAGIFSKPFDKTLINFEDNSALIDYAIDLADDVVAATANVNNPCAIKFFDNGVEFEKTNKAFGMELGNGNLIKDEAEATEYLLTSFFSFLYNDGENYLNSLLQIEEFGITDQDLTAISNADLIETKNQTATDENWDVSAVKINNPVNLTMGENGKFNIRSLYMNELSNVKLVADLDGKTLELANLEVSPFDDNDFSLKLATESGVYQATDGNKYFVPTERYNDLENFRLEIDDAKYQALNNIETQWVINFGKGLNADQAQVEKNVKMLTNLAYFFQSDELSTVLDNYEAITGEKFYKYQEFKDNSGQKIPTGFTEEQIAYDFSDPKQKEEFLNLMGVRSDKIGEYGNITSFDWSEDILKGQGTTWGWWFDGELRLGAGSKISMRPEYNTTENEVVSTQVLHEFGHLFGYHHYSSFCYGEAVDTGARALYSLVNLMGEADLLPYDTLDYTIERCGFNQVEKFIYENGDKFPELSKYLDSVKEQRNANYDAIIPKIQQWENQTNSIPEFLRSVMVAATKTPIEQYLNVQDKGAYQVNGNTSCFYKL